jgi:hypothetical protein
VLEKDAPEAAGGAGTLFHYATEEGQAGILQSEGLNPSLKALSPNEARFRNGQYLTDIVPGSRTQAELSYDFLGPSRSKAHGLATTLRLMCPGSGLCRADRESSSSLTRHHSIWRVASSLGARTNEPVPAGPMAPHESKLSSRPLQRNRRR